MGSQKINDDDSDRDTVLTDTNSEAKDNCVSTINGNLRGKCLKGKVDESNVKWYYNTLVTGFINEDLSICDSHEDCKCELDPDCQGSSGYCSMNYEDSDNDGIGDACDNCMLVHNQNQLWRSAGVDIICENDFDGDDLFHNYADPNIDDADNCKEVPNGPYKGVCLLEETYEPAVGVFKGIDKTALGPTKGLLKIYGTDYYICRSDEDCETGYCSMNYEDADKDGIGDACDQVSEGCFICKYNDDAEAIDIAVPYNSLLQAGYECESIDKYELIGETDGRVDYPDLNGYYHYCEDGQWNEYVNECEYCWCIHRLDSREGMTALTEDSFCGLDSGNDWCEQVITMDNYDYGEGVIYTDVNGITYTCDLFYEPGMPIEERRYEWVEDYTNECFICGAGDTNAYAVDDATQSDDDCQFYNPYGISYFDGENKVTYNKLDEEDILYVCGYNEKDNKYQWVNKDDVSDQTAGVIVKGIVTT
ncbi:MAG: hypothetical protein KKF44_00405 [Nanoarchaeota archaeon]|nr:hypothetical protein [Nanoarchaeota archaeon]